MTYTTEKGMSKGIYTPRQRSQRQNKVNITQENVTKRRSFIKLIRIVK